LSSTVQKGAEHSKARKCKWLSRFHHFNFEKAAGCPVTLGCLALSTGISVFIANAREGNPIKRPNPDWVWVAPLKGEVASSKSLMQVKLAIKEQDYYLVHMSCMSLRRPTYAKAT
jgi:hypothetical protein